MDNSLLRKKDLVDNPTARVPICLCLDTSDSMGRVVGGDYRKTGETEFKDGRMWNVVEGETISVIDKLVAGVKLFYDELNRDDFAKYSAEICIVTFGGKSPQLLEDFANIERQTKLPKFIPNGDTPMGEAVNMALDCLESRKQEYKDAGVDYFQPWLVLMTDGEPNGSVAELNRAIKRTCDLVTSKRLTIFPLGIGDEADMSVLTKFSPNRSPLKLQGLNFKEFFAWLSQSVSRTSQSMPGEAIKLDVEGIKGWAEL
jgi:uncharacterized protein YegL